MAKIVIAIAAVVLLLCTGGLVLTAGSIGAVGFLASRIVQSDSAQVAGIAAKITDFTLPAGYKPEAAVEIAGYQYVSYALGDGHSHVMLIQAPAGAVPDQATLEQYAQQAAPQRGYDRRARSQVVSQTKATIRGQESTLVVSEGTNSDGQPYRAVTGVFQARGGTALVSVESPVSTWNQELVDTFIASIH